MSIVRKVYTCVFLRDPGGKKILLGYKKRGFGAQKWNGLGGKVEPNETILEGAKREVKEESGFDAIDLKQVAHLEFQYEPDMHKMMECHIFECSDFKGEMIETEEMKPHWFNESDIPYTEMWRDDIFWLPHVISSKYVKAQFVFAEDHETILSQILKVFDTKLELDAEIKSAALIN